MAAAQDGQEPQEPLGPFKLRASLHETIWGGQRLRALAGKALPEGKRIGESWETALDSVVVTAPHAEQTLGRLVEAYGVALLGSRAVAVYGLRFPLLAKFIDAHDWLSVQAHPDDAYAAAHEGGKLGKTETWYILAAEPGAQVVYGFARETSREAVRAAIAANALEPLLRTVEIHAGDVIFVPAGTVHAIGAGVTLYELQEYSDVTYRLYDYGRLQANGQPRELHVERALEVMRATPAPLERVKPLPLPAQPGLPTRTILVACRYFVEEELRLDGTVQEEALPSSCRILTLLSGEAEIISERSAAVRLVAGETAVLPASLGDALISGAATIVSSYVPEPDDEALALWRRAHDGVFSDD
jgi:mannose-6-phosphate isomerase